MRRKSADVERKYRRERDKKRRVDREEPKKSIEMRMKKTGK